MPNKDFMIIYLEENFMGIITGISLDSFYSQNSDKNKNNDTYDMMTEENDFALRIIRICIIELW